MPHCSILISLTSYRTKSLGLSWVNTACSGLQKDVVYVSWLTNSALVYEPKCGGGGGLRGLSYEYSWANRAPKNFGDLTPYLTYSMTACKLWRCGLIIVKSLAHRFHYQWWVPWLTAVLTRWVLKKYSAWITHWIREQGESSAKLCRFVQDGSPIPHLCFLLTFLYVYCTNVQSPGRLQSFSRPWRLALSTVYFPVAVRNAICGRKKSVFNCLHTLPKYV
jgi:hypothetical protein